MNKYLSAAMFSLLTASLLSASPSQSSDARVEELTKRLMQMQEQMKQMENELKKLKKAQKKTVKKVKRVSKKLNMVKAHDAFDNIKWGIDFRPAYDYIHIKYNDYKYKDKHGNVHDLSGTTAQNPSLLSTRLYLNMKSSPTPKLTFTGQVAMYSTWGGNNLSMDPSIKDWEVSSKATDTTFRLRRAYFVYSDSLLDGKLPYSFSVGRRPSTDGFLANYREGDKEPGSPLAHITNMEVDAAMVKLTTENYIPLEGSYLKLVYGRAHNGVMQANDALKGYAPYAAYKDLGSGVEDKNVNFFVAIFDAYNDGQYDLMMQHATIFNTKGMLENGTAKKAGAGRALLDAISLQVNGVGNEINDFLDNTTLFASFATSYYMPAHGYKLLGSTSKKYGYSYWFGAVFPDMITENGKIGLEYNHGSKYWTPMTWAEDTAIGSKIAVRGDAYEAYWNFNLFGIPNFTGQLRYTYLQHDYTPNIRCSGWVAPKDVDIEAEDFRFYLRYIY